LCIPTVCTHVSTNTLSIWPRYFPPFPGVCKGGWGGGGMKGGTAVEQPNKRTQRLVYWPSFCCLSHINLISENNSFPQKSKWKICYRSAVSRSRTEQFLCDPHFYHNLLGQGNEKNKNVMFFCLNLLCWASHNQWYSAHSANLSVCVFHSYVVRTHLPACCKADPGCDSRPASWKVSLLSYNNENTPHSIALPARSRDEIKCKDCPEIDINMCLFAFRKSR
jgi:hypothetical protein